MTQTFTLELSPNTVIGSDFVAEFSPPRRAFGGRFIMRQTFVDSGTINTIPGQMVGDRIERPVIQDYSTR
jgi:hypothetical protein